MSTPIPARNRAAARRPAGTYDGGGMTATAHTADVALRDGSTVRVRPVRHEDEPELRALLDRLSEDSRWLRFFTAGANLDRKAEWAASMSGGRGVGGGAPPRAPPRVLGRAARPAGSARRARLRRRRHTRDARADRRARRVRA